MEALTGAPAVYTATDPASSGPGGQLAPVDGDAVPVLPRQARTLRDTGLEPRFVTALVVKAMHAGGKTPLSVLTGRLHLSVGVVREVMQGLIAAQQAEVAWSGDADIDVHYQLTAFGQRAAADYLAESRYCGPAPVPLAHYRSVVEQQSLRLGAGLGAGVGDAARSSPNITPGELRAVLGEDGLEPAVRELIGAALHSQRPLMLYGPSGSGKTTLARKLARLRQDPVAVPYAVLVKHEIVQLYDPALHPAPLANRRMEERRSCDARWALCQRPLVHIGAELTRDMLELRADPGSGMFHAPPHLSANNGLLVVDDLGRQRMPAGELLHRLLAAFEHGRDHVAVPGGPAHALPFDVSLVLATSLAPESVLDESCLRRIGYRIAIGPLHEAGYRALVQRQARLSRLEADQPALDYLVNELHRRTRRPLLAAYPQELVQRILDFAGFTGRTPRFDVDSVAQAWSSLFGAGSLPLAMGDLR